MKSNRKIFNSSKMFNPVYLIIVLWLVFSSPFFLEKKTPYPSDYQTNFFAPASVYPEKKGPVKNNAQPDIISQIYPWRHFTIEELKSGRLPFWNPYSFAGTPHLANYQSAVLFPLNILFFLPISFIDAWSLLVLFQPLLAGIFMYLFSRKLGTSKIGSTVSSISFMFCGFLVTWLGYATLGYAILFLPLALYSILQFKSTHLLRWLALFSITFPLSFFAGHFQTSLYFLLGVLTYLTFITFFDRKKENITVWIFAFAGVLLTMPQVLPSIELYTLSVRSNLYQKVEAIPTQYISTLFSPDFFGNPVTRNDWFGHYAEWNGFAGIIALALAAFTILFYRNRKTVFFILLGLLSILLAFDTPLLDLLVFLKIPVLSTSAASRIIVLFSFSIAVLAGFGFDQLFQSKTKIRKIFIWSASVGFLFILSHVVGFLIIEDPVNQMVALKNSLLPAGVLIGFYCLVLIVMKFKNEKVIQIVSLAILLLVSFEMYRFSSKWQNFDPKENVYPPVGITQFYKSQNQIDRAVGLSGAEDAVFYRVPILTGYDPLYKEEYGEFIQYVSNGKIATPERSVVTFPLKGKYTQQALNFLGVKYVVHKVSDGSFAWAFPFDDYPLTQFTKIFDDGYYNVFQNNSAHPRTYLVPEVIKADHKDIPDHMFANDLKKVAFVEEHLNNGRLATGAAKIVSYTPTKVIIETQSMGPSFLVLTDNYYPGWDVVVNGKKGKVLKTNYSFRGVLIPEGKNNVEFNYLPMSFLIGAYLFFTGLLIIIVVVVTRMIGKK